MEDQLDFSSARPGQKFQSEASEHFAVYAAMPDPQKYQLCAALLEEFGATIEEETSKGELRHKCSLPLGGHTDGDSVTASINYKKLTFRCYVCGARGGLLWWIATNRGEDVDQAWMWLQDASGITSGLDLPDLLEILRKLLNPEFEKKFMPSYDERILQPWWRSSIYHPYLTAPVHFSEGSNIGGREIPVENLDRFRIGFCGRDDDWRYYQRIILPLWWEGSLIGWQARQVPEVNGWRKLLDPADQGDPQEMKFKFSPDVPRDRIFYGTDEALSAREVLVVESGMSVLRHAHHLPILGTLGAAVSDNQLPFLHRKDKVVLWLDNDPAGWDALTGIGEGRKHVAGLLEKLRDYVDVRVVQSPWWKADPADLTEKEASELYRTAKPSVLWRRPDVRKLNWYDRRAA